MNNRIVVSRRTLLAGTGLAASSTLWAGCSGGGGKDLAQPEGKVPSKYKNRTRVVFWAAYPQYLKPQFETLVGGFNESQEDIFVEVQFQTDYESVVQQLIRGLKSRQAPDLALFDVPLWKRFVANGVLEPLDDYYSKADLSTDDYVDAFLEEGTEDDKLYWVPFNRSTPLFYYNKDVFAAAGAPAAGPATWSEFREFAPEVQRQSFKGRKIKAHAILAPANNWTFNGMAHAWNGAVSDGLDLTVNEGGAVEAAEWMRKLVFEDKVAYQSNDVSVDFVNGVTASTIQTTGQLATLVADAKFDVGVAFCPKELSPGTPTGGAGLSMLTGTPQDRKDAAFEFIKYAGQAEVAAQWSVDTGYLPTTKSAAETKILTDFIAKNPNFKVAVDQLEVARSMDDILTRVPGTQSVLNTGLEKIYGENADTQSTLDGVSKQLDALAEPVRDQ